MKIYFVNLFDLTEQLKQVHSFGARKNKMRRTDLDDEHPWLRHINPRRTAHSYLGGIDPQRARQNAYPHITYGAHNKPRTQETDMAALTAAMAL